MRAAQNTWLSTDIDIGVCLNVVNVLAVQSELMTAALHWAYDSCSDRVTQFKRTSNRNHPLARSQLTGVAQSQCRQLCLLAANTADRYIIAMS